MKAAALGWVVAMTLACGAPAEPSGAHHLSVQGPPFAAWLESAPAGPAAVVLVVVPTQPLGAPIEVRVHGEAEQVARLAPTGGRLELPLAHRHERLQIEATWRHPEGTGGATAVLGYPAGTDLGPPAFEPIAATPDGRRGQVDEAIRIR